ncbi:CPBP family intramembrane glutamic endopeptidase [Austwickia chelonae]|uniref:CPBP family intramembrane glutamic endopeptidase n=1 Tax=Austwickia chelonae TaxID=100225 RepID=UPI000E243F3D|nr:type II CAAX endopeptidase family protein [Austwickia chelonae]
MTIPSYRTEQRTPAPYPPLKVALITMGLCLTWIAVSLFFSLFAPGTYEEAGKDARLFILRLGIPMITISIIATYFLLRRGTFHRLWREPTSVPQAPKWMYGLAVIPVVGAVAGVFFQIGNIFQGKAPLALAAVVTLCAVGYVEELVCRGFVIDEMRRGGFSELHTALFSCLLFGSWHLPNAFIGVPIGTVIIQFFASALLGSLFYFLRRSTRKLWPGAAAHAGWDMMAFSLGS